MQCIELIDLRGRPILGFRRDRRVGTHERLGGDRAADCGHRPEPECLGLLEKVGQTRERRRKSQPSVGQMGFEDLDILGDEGLVFLESCDLDRES